MKHRVFSTLKLYLKKIVKGGKIIIKLTQNKLLPQTCKDDNDRWCIQLEQTTLYSEILYVYIFKGRIEI